MQVAQFDASSSCTAMMVPLSLEERVLYHVISFDILYRRVIILHLTHQLQSCNDSVCISALTSPKCQTMLAKESYLDPLKMAKEAAAIVFTISSIPN